MQSEKIAKRSAKISIISLLSLLVLGMIVVSISITQINSIAQMDRKIKALELEINQLKNAQ